MMAGNATIVPFAFFVSLCRELSYIAPRCTDTRICSTSKAEPMSLKVFRRWVHELRRLFPKPPPGTTTILFLLLFPEEDTRRKYGMKEASLAKALTAVLGFSDEGGDRGATLKKWADPSTAASSLGEEVSSLLCLSSNDSDDLGKLSIQDVNSMLDDLASNSSFSALCLRRPRIDHSRTRQEILRSVYHGLGPLEAAVLTQVILKDLRPILYPVKTASTTESLLNSNSKSIHILTLQEAMGIWDPSNTLLHCYKVQCTIEHSVRLFEESQMNSVIPEIGIPVQISKCVKGLGCKDALIKCKSNSSVWVETKYDGERMQIHVSVDQDGRSTITIFSKSRRDSTLDRIATHWVIKEALGLRHNDSDEVRAQAPPRTGPDKNVSSVILEAEMVAYDEDSGIDEYWQIRDLIESSAVGPRRKKRDNQRTTDSFFGTSRHLALVFFDILYLNGSSLLSESYCSRRETLEAVINCIPMYASLARRVEIPLSDRKSFDQRVDDLQRIFASSVTNHEEGLILKAADAVYADWRHPWVKLKKDYIPGYGDAMDFVLVGAAWGKERGRTLQVPRSTYTTFHVGAFCNNLQSSMCRPHLEVLFTVSYGLDRRQLEELNFLIKSMGAAQYSEDNQMSGLPFTYALARGLSKPSTILTSPLLVEVFGAGFTKSDAQENYELRFPRISKIHRINDRSWLEGVSVLELNEIALRSVGKDKTAPVSTGDYPSLCISGSLAKRKAFENPSTRKHEHLNNDVPTESFGRQIDHSGSRPKKRCRLHENDGLDSSSNKTDEVYHPFAVARTFGRNTKGPLRCLTNIESVSGAASLFCGTSSCCCCTGRGKKSKDDENSLKVSILVDGAGGSERHALAKFLGKAIIFLDCSFHSQGYDTAFIDQFVMPNTVHSQEAFALGCRWHHLKAAQSKYDYGVVFVDEQSSQNWSEAPPFGTLPHSVRTRTCRRSIFVFSADCLRTATLNGGWLEKGLNIKTKCLAVYL